MKHIFTIIGGRLTALAMKGKGRPGTQYGAAILAALMLLFGVQPSFAEIEINGPTTVGEICMQKVYGTPVTNANKLNCTAGDIRLSRAISVSPASCIRGTKFDLTATFEVNVTANARYDAGFFFRLDGGSNARGDGSGATGECSLSRLDPPPPPNEPALNLDGDTCGDLNSGTYNVTFTIPDVSCVDSDGDGNLNLPNCTSWHSNQGTVCDINNAFTFKPDTKSKCVCDDTFQVPVKVEDASISVTKTASPTQVPEPGGTVTYTVDIKNGAQVQSVVIKSITDDIYGDLGMIPTCLAGEPSSTVPACTPANVTSCQSLIDQTLAAGATVSCEFNGYVEGDASDRVTDTVTVTARQPSTGKDITDTAKADVDITDVYTEPTVEKKVKSTAGCQLDATYQVVVSNNSEADTLTLNSLNDDKFGDITRVEGDVVSTSCVTGGAIGPLGNYSCSFVGRISSTSCNFTHTNKVTAGTTDDDGQTSSPSDDAAVSVSTTP